MDRQYSIGKATTAGGAVTLLTGNGKLGQIIITTDGTNDVSVLVGDDSTEIFTLKADGADEMRSIPLAGELTFTVGLKVTVTGVGGSAYALYREI